MLAGCSSLFKQTAPLMWSAVSVTIPSSEPDLTLVSFLVTFVLPKKHKQALCVGVAAAPPDMETGTSSRTSCGWAEDCYCICGPSGGAPWPLEEVPCYTWPFEPWGGGRTMLLLTLLMGTFGFSESLMWLCERPALAEVRDERTPATVQRCPMLVVGN